MPTQTPCYRSLWHSVGSRRLPPLGERFVIRLPAPICTLFFPDAADNLFPTLVKAELAQTRQFQIDLDPAFAENSVCRRRTASACVQTRSKSQLSAKMAPPLLIILSQKTTLTSPWPRGDDRKVCFSCAEDEEDLVIFECVRCALRQHWRDQCILVPWAWWDVGRRALRLYSMLRRRRPSSRTSLVILKKS